MQYVITLAGELISAEQGMRWAKEFSDQQKKPLHNNVDLLKNEVETWQNSYNRVYDKYRKYKTEANQLQSKINELEKENEWTQVSDRLPKLEIHTVGNITTRDNSYECIVSDGITSWVDCFTLDEGFHESIIKWRPIPKP
jgi:predicted nuclease with TOPRIM domain